MVSWKDVIRQENFKKFKKKELEITTGIWARDRGTDTEKKIIQIREHQLKLANELIESTKQSENEDLNSYFFKPAHQSRGYNKGPLYMQHLQTSE